jgi:hypothetical protein
VNGNLGHIVFRLQQNAEKREALIQFLFAYSTGNDSLDPIEQLAGGGSFL